MKYTILHQLQQGTQEWLDFRKGKISGSMAPSIMGENPYKSRLDLWEEIMTGKEIATNPDMERGKRLEPHALQWLNEATGRNYRPVVLQSLEHPWLIVSLDAYCEVDGKVYIAEIKCPRESKHIKTFLTRTLPEEYHAQLQHEMMLAGVDTMNLVSYIEGSLNHQPCIIPVEKDVGYCKKLFAEEEKFRQSLIECKPPAPTDDDWVISTDWDLTCMAARYEDIGSLMMELEMEQKTIRQKMIDATTHPRTRIGSLKVQKVSRRGDVDYSKIPELQGVDLDAYRKPTSTSWRIY